MKHTVTSEVTWELVPLSSTVSAKMTTYSVIVTISVSYDFWHYFAGKGVLNVLGGVLP